ncbi:MAG: HpcH/HpaI aldolase family protein [Burkholderiales bacterium]
MNRAKEKLRSGETVLVFNPNFASPALVEYAGELGFDVVFIDCEHGTADFERVQDLARAARAGGMTSILRPWSKEPGLITRFLDCGVGGIQFPRIDDAAMAHEVVRMVRDARGERFADTLVTAMIESPEGVASIDEIVSVAGLDVVVVGMADLSRALGHAGESSHSDVSRAVDTVIAAARRSRHVAAGYNLHQWEKGRALKDKGVRWFTIHARGMLRRAGEELRASLNGTSGV